MLAESNVKHVIMACLDPEVGERAKRDLELTTGKTDVFEVVALDLRDPKSVNRVADNLQGPIDGLVMNAGGVGGGNRLESSEVGVPNIVAVNLLGHVQLVERMLKKKKLAGSVILSGSEAALGSARFGLPAPVLESGSVEEMKTILNGSFFEGKKSEDAYGYTKLLGALWMASMAAQVPSVRFVTMSPGGCSGTAVADGLPFWKRTLLTLAVPIMVYLGIMHTACSGAKRYVDALVEHEKYTTGGFYASKLGRLSGEVIDQSTISATYRNLLFQKNAHTAISAFLE